MENKERPHALGRLFEQTKSCVSSICHKRVWTEQQVAAVTAKGQRFTSKTLILFGTQHNPGILVSLAVSLETRILGPLFVEPGIKVSGACHLAMVRDQWMPKLHACPHVLSSPQSLWLEDGAP